ncbi:MAG: ABC transporter permease [Pararhodobacter sp.]
MSSAPVSGGNASVSGVAVRRATRWFWPGVGLFCLIVMILAPHVDWLSAWPRDWVIPLADWISAAMQAFVDSYRWFFRGVARAVDLPLTAVRALLQSAPWIVIVVLAGALAWRARGFGLAALTVAALCYMVVTGYWRQSMNTLSLVAVSVPLSVLLGFAMGAAAARSEGVNRVVQPLLDFMQTIPAFAYLIPILFLFGFGPAVGLLASAIYAVPPMVRNTILGLRSVPQGIRESGVMSGCTRRQGFWMVQVPTALPQLMVGVNQTTMAALSMVIIAAIIGGFEDIGWEVLNTMRRAQFGQSLLAGLVIALMAIVMDRIGAGLARNRFAGETPQARTMRRRRMLTVIALLVAAAFLLADMIPLLADYPRDWRFYPAREMNEAVRWLLRTHGAWLEAVKNTVLFQFMLPVRIGFSEAITPFTWGFALKPWMSVAYGAAAVTATAVLAWRGRTGPALAVAMVSVLLWWGTTGLPWPVVIASVTALAWRAGGARVAIFVAASLGFVLVNGLWGPLMLSVYLCGIAVAISFALGGALGVWAAHNDRVSAFLRPINDTLQTMPQFVLLIPALMLFKVGEFTALLAIIAYAIVPPIRYVEAALRNLPGGTIEAARQMGCTPWQILLQVKLPLALPGIMLGLNQTIMYALAMLVIAALVGTQGLGQQVYLALSSGDMGRGVITGLSMALLAMVADRILQAASRRHRERLGVDQALPA